MNRFLRTFGLFFVISSIYACFNNSPQFVCPNHKQIVAIDKKSQSFVVLTQSDNTKFNFVKIFLSQYNFSDYETAEFYGNTANMTDIKSKSHKISVKQCTINEYALKKSTSGKKIVEQTTYNIVPCEYLSYILSELDLILTEKKKNGENYDYLQQVLPKINNKCTENVSIVQKNDNFLRFIAKDVKYYARMNKNTDITQKIAKTKQLLHGDHVDITTPLSENLFSDEIKEHIQLLIENNDYEQAYHDIDNITSTFRKIDMLILLANAGYKQLELAKKADSLTIFYKNDEIQFKTARIACIFARNNDIQSAYNIISVDKYNQEWLDNLISILLTYRNANEIRESN